MVVLQLGVIIQIMYRHCMESFGDLIDVRFEHRVVGTGQDNESAWVDLEVGEEKKRERMAADFVIGCDGNTSAVRKTL